MYNKLIFLYLLIFPILFLSGCNSSNTPQSNINNTNNTISTINVVDKQPDKSLDDKLQNLIKLAKTYKGKQADLLKETKINLGETNGYILIHTSYFAIIFDALKNIQKYKDYNLDSAKNKYNETKGIFAIYCSLYGNESDFMKNPTTIIKIGDKIIHPTYNSGQEFVKTSEYFPDPAYIGGCVSYFNVSDLGDAKNFQFIIVINGNETNFDVDLNKLKFNEF